ISGTQTAYVLALHFDMLPDSLRRHAAERLVENIRSYRNHITTGFLCTPYICHVLSRFGYTDVAYKLLLQDTYPSWLYPVKMGATTIWERWDGQKPDSTFQTPSMNSFNHYAYGAIGDWMYRVIVGLDTYEDGPGYKHIRIQPHIGGSLSSASASLQTWYGKLSSGWKTEAGDIMLEVEIPANTTATVILPSNNSDNITESAQPVRTIKEMKVIENGSDDVQVQLGSGGYHFVIKK
ncbi:MAG: alpha-L-rhamnosidase, partial [Bacteroidetes bacterium]|nr:alpha-L-rhamnosidase [Bacteroidota bacterium]